MNKKLFLSALVVTLGVAGASSLTQVQAQELSDGSNPLIQKLVQKFNLNEAEVKAVFEEAHAERETKMKEAMEAKLSQAVTNGTITEDQKQKIIAKQEELRKQRDARKEEMKNKTPQERKALMEAEKAELETWARENGIEDMNIFFVIKPVRHGGQMGQALEKVQQ